MDNHEKFVKDLRTVLIVNLGMQEDLNLACRCGASLLLEGINTIYKNSSNKNDFDEKIIHLFATLMNMYLHEENKGSPKTSPK